MSQVPHDSTTHDKHFYDSFMLVLGILICVAAMLIFVARMVAGQAQHQIVQDDAMVRQATAERLAPVGRVAVSGQDNSALAPPKETRVAAVQDLSGEQVFTMACSACHGTGVAGAPKYSDKAAWSPRIAQGMATLYSHALKGFQGKSGVMPTKGGRPDLSDKSITNAVDYMVKAAK